MSETSPVSNAASRTRRGISIRWKLPLAVIGLALLSSAAYAIISIRLSQQTLTKEIQNRLEKQVLTEVKVVQSDLLIAQTVAAQLASFSEIGYPSEDYALSIAREALRQNPQISGVKIAYEPKQFDLKRELFAPYYYRANAGVIAYEDLGKMDVSYLTKDWYAMPRATLSPFLNKPYLNTEAINNWTITWSVPFFSQTTHILKGVVAVDIAFTRTQSVVNAIQVGENGYAFMIDSNGKLLGLGSHGGNYQALMGSSLSPTYSEKTASWYNLLADMKAGKSGFTEAADLRDEDMFVAYAPVELNSDWSLALAFPKAEVFSTMNELSDTLFGYTAVGLLVLGALLFLLSNSISTPLIKLTEFANLISSETILSGHQGQFDEIKIRANDELGDLGDALNRTAAHLRGTFSALEDNIMRRTKELTRLTSELRTVADISREISSIRDQNALLTISASLIRERFNYYHVGVFLVDSRAEYATIHGASGASADKMIADNYKLKLSQASSMESVVVSGQPHIASDFDIQIIRAHDHYLPDTQSAIALPLRSHNLTVGILDVRDIKPDAFAENDIQSLQALADQISASLENTQLLKRLETTLEEASKEKQIQTQEAWRDTAGNLSAPAYEYDGMQIRAIPQNLPPELAAQLEKGEPVVHNASQEESALYVPLLIFGQVVGVVGLEQKGRSNGWTKEQIAVAQASANRAALTLENARLLEDSNRRAVKESAIFAAANRIGASSSIENILETAAEELEKILSDSEITIQFIDRSSES
ncbi:MAG: GAF domain-containing protein [Anaerolineales bacterium]|nr:GAF domain-containing protein [Anaerolineales bacterium]